VSFFGDFIARFANQTPQKIAIHFEAVDYTYAWLERQVLLASQWFAAQGLQPGDRVAYLGLNHPLFVIVLFALARHGAILVPLNYRLTAAEYEHQILDAQPALVLVDQQFAQQLRAIELPQFLVESLFERFSSEQAQLHSSIEKTAAVGRLTDDVLLVYTSGTTGHPKGALLTQNALVFNALNSIHAHELTSADRVLIALPMFHVGGLNIMLTPALSIGATVFIQPKFEPQQFLFEVEQWRPSLSLLVPATIQALIAHERWMQTDLSSLRLINTGSSIVPVPLLQAWHDRGIAAAQVYGSTETAPIAVYLLRPDTQRKIGSAGRCALHCEVKVIDQNEHSCPVGTVGEIVVRGPNVMRAYWNNPEATAQVLINGWFKTGDLAYCDDDGFFWIVGRSKDMIISGGENIYPAEIEMLVAQHQWVSECAVVGLVDEQWGEIPVLALVVKPEDAKCLDPWDEKQFISMVLDKKLARFKWPKRVVRMPSLPKTALGKVQKSVLRERLQALLLA
jgi:fatty-acyl-CoA synthase